MNSSCMNKDRVHSEDSTLRISSCLYAEITSLLSLSISFIVITRGRHLNVALYGRCLIGCASHHRCAVTELELCFNFPTRQ